MAILVNHLAMVLAAAQSDALRIMPLGDSITRGSYIARYIEGPRHGQAIGLPNPQGGGWRKPLQDQLRAKGVRADFVGELNYHAYGRNGAVDSNFDPDHHGLAGFSNRRIITGGAVPTLRDVLDALGVHEIVVPGIITVLRKHWPQVILLMSGANGFDAAARDELIRIINANSSAHLLVATLPPQSPPRAGWEKVDEYNATLPAIVTTQQAAGHRISLVEMNRALTPDDLLPDGVHPNSGGMRKMAGVWFQALGDAGFIPAKSNLLK